MGLLKTDALGSKVVKQLYSLCLIAYTWQGLNLKAGQLKLSVKKQAIHILMCTL